MAQRPLANPVTYGTIVTSPTNLSNLDTSFGAVFTSGFNDSSLGWVNYAADTGTANAYAVTLPQAPSSYAAGMCVSFTPQNNNTGASTINVNALGTKAIVSPGNVALNGGEINNAELCALVYDGTSFRIVSPCRYNTAISTATSGVTVNVAGYSSVSISYTFTSVSSTLTLNNLGYGVPVNIWFANTTGSGNNFALSGTDPAGTTFSTIAVVPGGTTVVINQSLANNTVAFIVGSLITGPAFKAVWGGK